MGSPWRVRRRAPPRAPIRLRCARIGASGSGGVKRGSSIHTYHLPRRRAVPRHYSTATHQMMGRAAVRRSTTATERRTAGACTRQGVASLPLGNKIPCPPPYSNSDTATSGTYTKTHHRTDTSRAAVRRTGVSIAAVSCARLGVSPLPVKNAKNAIFSPPPE